MNLYSIMPASTNLMYICASVRQTEHVQGQTEHVQGHTEHVQGRHCLTSYSFVPSTIRHVSMYR